MVAASGLRLDDGTNPIEAQVAIDEAVECMRLQPERSIGIVATNLAQADLIREQISQSEQKFEHVRDYMDRWRETLEDLFVKNLESVQGDERDTIIVSTVFGPTEPGGTPHQRFGPINGASGHRRLNVLFTRAKHQLLLVTSLKPSDVRPSEKTHLGVQILRDYLEYAATGRLATGSGPGGEPDSDFEIHVARLLEKAGYQTTPQVGVDGFRIDIGVKHREYPYGFLAGIECDGATYHSGVTARDRDRLRQQVLEQLGWRIYRIWSTDWFADPLAETSKMVQWLDAERAKVQLKPLALSAA
jgi:very-short-patch-repair endonuclease